MKTKTYDFRAFCRGDLVRTDQSNVDKMIGQMKKNPHVYAALVFGLAVVLMQIPVEAATTVPATIPVAPVSSGTHGGFTLIRMMQKGAFWLGMAVSIWGIVEAQLDFPGWRGRILKGVLGYIGVLLIPLIFLELQNNLGMDVWTQMQQNQEPALAPTGGVR